MWFNGDAKRRRRKADNAKGAKTNKLGWKTNNSRYKPTWKTNGVSKVDKRNLEYLLDEFDQEVLEEDDDYFRHHETLHSLSVNWQTGADPRDKFRKKRTAKGPKKKKTKRTQNRPDKLRGSVDCSRPETFDVMRSASRKKAKAYADRTKKDRIRMTYDRLKRNVYSIKRPQANSQTRSLTSRAERSRNMTDGRLRFASRKDIEFASRQCKSIKNQINYESTVSKRNKSKDSYLRHLKSRKAAMNKVELLTNMQNYSDEERKCPERDFMDLTLDEMYEEVVVKQTAFFDFKEVFAEDEAIEKLPKNSGDTVNNVECDIDPDNMLETKGENDGRGHRELEEDAAIRNLEIDVGKIMSVEKIYKIIDLRNLFYEIISRYTNDPNGKTRAQKAIFRICAKLDIVAIGKLAMENPEKLPVRQFVERTASM